MRLLGIAEIVGDVDQLERIRETECAVLATGKLQTRQTPATTRHLRAREIVLRVIGVNG